MRYKTPAALEMAAKAAARRSVLDTGRAMTGFYLHRLLCRIFSDPHHAFVLKGGQGMLARTVDARATKDIDLLCKERSLERALEELERLASADLGDHMRFTLASADPNIGADCALFSSPRSARRACSPSLSISLSTRFPSSVRSSSPLRTGLISKGCRYATIWSIPSRARWRISSAHWLKGTTGGLPHV